MYLTSGFGLACAPVRCTHPSFWVYCHAKRGAARPPAHRSFAASYSTPKTIYNLSNLGRPRQGLFSFHWTTAAMKYATIRPNSFVFFVFSAVFGSFLFVILFFFSPLHNRHIRHSEGFFEGAKPILNTFRVTINVYTGATIRTKFFLFSSFLLI
jgi:hypothetical protein